MRMPHTKPDLLGAALALREIVRVFEATQGSSPIGSFDFSWHETSEEIGTDQDLLELLNLEWPNSHFPTAAVTGGDKTASCVTPPRLMLIGESFTYQIQELMAYTSCPPLIDYWFFVRGENGVGRKTLHYLVPPQESVLRMASLPAAPEDLRASFRSADIVILEENESIIHTAKHVGELRNAVHN